MKDRDARSRPWSDDSSRTAATVITPPLRRLAGSIKETARLKVTDSERQEGLGHPGHRRAHLKPKTQPDTQERHPVGTCTGCGTDLCGAPIQKQILRQICVIPVPQAHWNEPIAEVRQCPCCKHKNQATFDHILDRDPSSKVMYGPNLRAYARHLSLH